jgi:hypothetical protein
VKTKIIYALMGMGLVLTIARVEAATIFAPTDGDVNFLFGDLAGGTLAMFDDIDQAYLGASINIEVPSIVGFVGPNGNGDHIAINNLSQTLTLTGSDNFILGIFFNGNWLADSSVLAVGANSYTVSFDNGGSVLQVDVQTAPAVPVPAAVWLFGSGLLGLVGVARKQASSHKVKSEKV